MAVELAANVDRPYKQDPAGHKQIRDFDHLLAVLNHIMGQGPHFTEHQAQVGLVGVPMNVSNICIVVNENIYTNTVCQATLDWPMATPSGYALFLDGMFPDSLQINI